MRVKRTPVAKYPFPVNSGRTKVLYFKRAKAARSALVATKRARPLGAALYKRPHVRLARGSIVKYMKNKVGVRHFYKKRFYVGKRWRRM